DTFRWSMVAVSLHCRRGAAAVHFRRTDYSTNSPTVEVRYGRDSNAGNTFGSHIDWRSYAQPRKRLPCADRAIDRHFLDWAVVRGGHRSSLYAKSHSCRSFRRDRARLGVRCLVCYDLTHAFLLIAIAVPPASGAGHAAKAYRV